MTRDKMMIEAEGLGRSYGNTVALEGLDLVVEEGEWLAITGPSGSGKSTLLNLIGCLDQPTSGSLVVGRIDVTRFSRREMALFRRETVGFVFQQFYLVSYLTAVENVMLARLAPLPRK